MRRYIIKLIIVAVTLLAASQYLIEGVYVTDLKQAIVTAFVISLLNTFVKPVLKFLTFPITVITLGLFLLIINAALIYAADFFVPGFAVDGFWPAILLGALVSFVTWLFDVTD